MAIISCPECNRQVSDKALKCPQCGYPIVNLEKPESVSLQVLQEKIQNVVSVNSLTVKVSPVGKSLNIKLTRTGVKIPKFAYDQLWMKIRLQLNPDNLRGFNKLLIASNFEGDSKSEWERQNDIDSTGKLIRNKEDKSRLIIVSILILISGGLISSWIIVLSMAGYSPFLVPLSASKKTDISSTSSPEYLLASIDKQSKDVSASELAPYTKALDQLVPKCQESRMELANMSSATKEILTKKGAKTNNLELLNGVYQIVQYSKTPEKCASVFLLFADLVNK